MRRIEHFFSADRTREARMPRSKTPPESTLANEVAVFCRVKTSPIGIVVLEATAACSKTKAVIAPPTKWHIKLQLLVPSAGYARAECSLHAAFHANGCLASWHHSSFALMGSLARALQTHGRLNMLHQAWERSSDLHALQPGCGRIMPDRKQITTKCGTLHGTWRSATRKVSVGTVSG